METHISAPPAFLSFVRGGLAWHAKLVAWAVLFAIGITTVEGQTLGPVGSPLPRFFAAVRDFRPDQAGEVEVIGLGSSVGNGAGLANPEFDAPVNYMVRRLNERLNRIGASRFVARNYSINGSVMVDGVNTAYPRAVTEGHPGKLVLIAYGMNDGMTPHFNSGQTYTGVAVQMSAMVDRIRLEGADPVICTTPHPHTQRTGWAMPNYLRQIYPTLLDPPVSDNALYPSVANSVVNVSWKGRVVPVSYRHWRVNEAIRAVAFEKGVALLDVERYWFDYIGEMGVDSVYAANEYVHPNQLGYQISYHAAIDDFIDSLVDASRNSSAPADITLESVSCGFAFNTAGPVTINLPSATGGTLTINASQNGIGSASMTVPFTAARGSVGIGTPLVSFVGNGTPISDVRVDSGKVKVYLVAPNTYLRWVIHAAPF